MNLGSSQTRTLDEYCPECAGLMDLKSFDTLVRDDKNLVIYSRNRFGWDAALGTWKRR